MVQYEFRVVDTTKSLPTLEAEVNKLGADGWEFAGQIRNDALLFEKETYIAENIVVDEIASTRFQEALKRIDGK